MRSRLRSTLAALGAVTLTTAVAACGSSGSTGSSSSAATSSSSAAASSAASSGSGTGSGSGSAASGSGGGAPVDLKAAGCPDTVVIQTDWNPEAEHGHLYQMFGDDYTIDSGKKAVSGPLMSGGADTGVKLEVRAGGPAIGFQTVSSQMYQDKDITMGYVSTDEAIKLSTTTPTKAVFAPLDIAPIMVMWDPATYPNVTDVKGISEALKASGGVWRYFSDSAYMEYLKSAGYADTAFIDPSYDGTPANFVAAKGQDMQQGFASAEPYIYQNEVADWAKPVKYALISDTGWVPYFSAMSVRSDDFASLSGCMKALVPVLQQATVDYFADPAKANNLIFELVKEYNTGWTYSQGVADYSVKTMLDQKLVGNGPNSTLGDFDEARMTKFFTDASQVMTTVGSAPKQGLTAADIYTNEFIDTSIGLK